MKKHGIALLLLFSMGISMVFAGGAGEKDNMQPEEMKGDDLEAGPGDAMMMAGPSKAVFDLSGLGPGVLPYTGEASAQRLASQKRVVYFFAADWCPTCRATYDDLKAQAGNVPEDIVILVVDYDRETELKAKYGVTYQHTYVALGPMGGSLKTWSGSMTLKDIVKETPK